MSNNRSARRNEGGTWFLTIPEDWGSQPDGTFKINTSYAGMWTKKKTPKNRVLKVEVYGGFSKGYNWTRTFKEPILIQRNMNILISIYMLANKINYDYIGFKQARSRFARQHAPELTILIKYLDGL